MDASEPSWGGGDGVGNGALVCGSCAKKNFRDWICN